MCPNAVNTIFVYYIGHTVNRVKPVHLVVLSLDDDDDDDDAVAAATLVAPAAVAIFVQAVIVSSFRLLVFIPSLLLSLSLNLFPSNFISFGAVWC